jgi:hypothetical protein
MSDLSLFDDLEAPDRHDHAHTDGCTFCATRDGLEAAKAGKAAVDRDEEWTRRADGWLNTLYIGVIITADDLIADEGLPNGSANQVGARFSAWAKAGRIRIEGVRQATRRESHGRLLRTWQVIA